MKPPEEEGGVPEYEVVTHPVGATVDSLPEGTVTKTIKDTEYFVYAETFYRPFYAGSDVVYMVVADPTGA